MKDVPDESLGSKICNGDLSILGTAGHVSPPTYSANAKFSALVHLQWRNRHTFCLARLS